MVNMKLKITITGQRVHEVGYRVFLRKLAMSLAMPGFTAYNWKEEGHQEVITLIEGDPTRIDEFRAQVEGRKPEQANVSAITFEEYDGDVGRTSEYAMFLSFEQLDKAIPLLIDMRDDMKEVKIDIKEMKSDIKAVRKIGEETLAETKAVRKIGEETLAETKAVRKIGDATLDEIKGLREDIQPGYAMQMQVDVKAIKERLGMS